jgi:hypothetical protein
MVLTVSLLVSKIVELDLVIGLTSSYPQQEFVVVL